jgi:hypothetical protein
MKTYATAAVIIAASLSVSTVLANPPGSGMTNGAGCVENCGRGGEGGNGGAGGKGGTAFAAAAAAASAKAQQAQQQGQAQGQGQGQQQGQEVYQGQGNYQGTESYMGLNQYYSADPGRNNTPSIGLGGLYPSSPCMGTSNIGGSGPGMSLAFGTSWQDDDCGIRETARLFGVSSPDGIAVLCSSKYAAAAPSCKAAAKKAEAPATVADQADKKKTSGERVQISGVQQPVTCVSDEYVARRMGTTVCK